MKISKKAILIGVTVIAVGGGIGAILESQDPSQGVQVQPAEVNEQVEVTPDVAEVEAFDIEVESQTVKEVDGKYRYFFSINNRDDRDFTGKVHIEGKTGSGTRVISQRVDFADQPLKSGLSSVVYADASSAPESVAGEYGVSSYSYVLNINNMDSTKVEKSF